MKCIRGFEVQILKSAAGYYLGTLDYDGLPNCRISSQYARTKEEAKKLRYDRQYAMEIGFCNGGMGCFSNAPV